MLILISLKIFLEAAGFELSHFQQYYCLQSRGKPWWETDLGFVITNKAWNTMTACLLSNVPFSGIVAQDKELVLQSQVLVPSATSQFNSNGDLMLEVTSLGRLAKYTHGQQVAQQASQALAQVAATAEFLGSELGITETGVLRSLSAALSGRLHPTVPPRPSAPYLNLPDDNVDLSYLAVPELSDGLRQAVMYSIQHNRYQALEEVRGAAPGDDLAALLVKGLKRGSLPEQRSRVTRARAARRPAFRRHSGGIAWSDYLRRRRKSIQGGRVMTRR